MVNPNPPRLKLTSNVIVQILKFTFCYLIKKSLWRFRFRHFGNFISHNQFTTNSYMYEFTDLLIRGKMNEVYLIYFTLNFFPSVDARERDFGVAERWSDESVFASRAYFLPERRPAELGVDRVKATDQGIYRCRVDFKQAQTRNSRVNLTVIGESHFYILYLVEYFHSSFFNYVLSFIFNTFI